MVSGIESIPGVKNMVWRERGSERVRGRETDIESVSESERQREIERVRQREFLK